MIPISKPHIFPSSIKYILNVLNSKILTDGHFQKITESIIKRKLKSNFVAVTHSCSAALEISAILINLKPGDEVIIPSYGFVSIANAIIMRGAKPVFVEVNSKTLNICTQDIIKQINKKTKAIYIIHYAGNACDMKELIKIKNKYKLYLIEDAAHSFLGKYNNKSLGTIGDIGVFSFHETKNFVAGQGGCISINNKKLTSRANYILDKGTNRIKFIKDFKKKIIESNKVKNFYSWVDIGSEYRASELSSALLLAQLEKSSFIQKKRKIIWDKYKKIFNKIDDKKVTLVKPIKNSKSSYNLLALIFNELKVANEFKKFLKKKGIAATFHYVPLHNSKMGKLYSKRKLPLTENIYRKIVRLPLFSNMNESEFTKIKKSIENFFYK